MMIKSFHSLTTEKNWKLPRIFDRHFKHLSYCPLAKNIQRMRRNISIAQSWVQLWREFNKLLFSSSFLEGNAGATKETLHICICMRWFHVSNMFSVFLQAPVVRSFKDRYFHFHFRVINLPVISSDLCSLGTCSFRCHSVEHVKYVISRYCVHCA